MGYNDFDKILKTFQGGGGNLTMPIPSSIGIPEKKTAKDLGIKKKKTKMSKIEKDKKKNKKVRRRASY